MDENIHNKLNIFDRRQFTMTKILEKVNLTRDKL